MPRADYDLLDLDYDDDRISYGDDNITSRFPDELVVLVAGENHRVVRNPHFRVVYVDPFELR